MKESAFIVSKPLQYFNAANIADENKKILLIVDGFADARKFYEKVKAKSRLWNECYFFKDNYAALEFCLVRKFEKLYLDGDYGLKLAMVLKKIKSRIFVYEEGVGSYLPELRTKISANLKKNKISDRIKDKIITTSQYLLGNRNYHAGYRKTEGIYLYNHNLHKANLPNFKKERLTFDRSFRDHLTLFEDRDLISSDNGQLLTEVKGKKVLLYLSTWFWNDAVIEKIDEDKEVYKILKPHPYLKTETLPSHALSIFNKMVYSGSMVEFLINDLLRNVEQLTVVHHGSSALQYFDLEPKLNNVVIDV